MGLPDPPQSPRDRTRELSKNMDKVTATQKRLGYLLSHPRSISSIFEVHCLIPLYVFSASQVAPAEALVLEKIPMKMDGLGGQSVSLRRSQIEVCLISGVVARMMLQATIDAVGRTVGAEEVKRS